MNHLIYAEDLYMAMLRIKWNDSSDREAALELIENAPTVFGVAKVTMCRDCRLAENLGEYTKICKISKNMRRDDDYCSLAQPIVK